MSIHSTLPAPAASGAAPAAGAGKVLWIDTDCSCSAERFKSIARRYVCFLLASLCLLDVDLARSDYKALHGHDADLGLNLRLDDVDVLNNISVLQARCTDELF